MSKKSRATRFIGLQATDEDEKMIERLREKLRSQKIFGQKVDNSKVLRFALVTAVESLEKAS